MSEARHMGYCVEKEKEPRAWVWWSRERWNAVSWRGFPDIAVPMSSSGYTSSLFRYTMAFAISSCS